MSTDYWAWPRIYTERVLVIVKPDSIDKVDEIRELVEKQGFSVLRSERMLLTVEKACELYVNHTFKFYFACLCRHMASGDIHVFILGRHDALSAWRTMMGPTDPIEAKQCQPLSLRAIYGTSMIFNAVHGSTNNDSFRREMSLIFPDEIVEPILSGNEAVDYYNEKIAPVLLKGLTELCKQKPKFPDLWLADWLDENNPYSPKTTPLYKVQEPFVKYPLD